MMGKSFMSELKRQPLVSDEKAIQAALKRRLEPAGVFPNRDEAIGLLKTQPLRVYLGIDPTGPDIHLGHTIPLLFLKQLWQLGHTPVIVIGDFTARIGDPTGKDATRKPLSPEDITKNMAHYLPQLKKILPEGSFEVLYNNDWLSKLSFGDVVQLASHMTVQQMIKREMFQERLAKERPIGLHEFLYPLMQGYDSVAMKIDGEVGGNDQTFNMLVGRELEKKLLNKDKLVFATRLLVAASSGKKMSKSEGELIALSDEPQEIRRKILAIDDSMIQTVFELCTEKPQDWINENKSKAPREWKEELADELVRMYRGETAVGEAHQAKEVSLGSDTIPLTAALKLFGVASSMTISKTLIDQGAVEVNEEVIKDWDFRVKLGDRVQVGKGKKFIAAK